jgi:uncharacterized protein with FMN-binding domain
MERDMPRTGCRFTGRAAALSSAAILAIYAAGYTATEHAAQGAPSNASADVVAGSSTATSAAAVTPTAPAQVSAQKPNATPAPGTSGAYRDGTYLGTGTSRHGSIEATVTVSGGKIAAVEISQCLTRYSCSRISALPPEVVARQSAKVDYISGATDSSRAFAQAVANALAAAA